MTRAERQKNRAVWLSYARRQRLRARELRREGRVIADYPFLDVVLGRALGRPFRR